MIKYDKRNYRKHDERNKALIKKSLEDCGTGRSIVIDNDNSIIAGNGVYEQAAALGLPVRIIETDGKELIAVKRTDINTDDDKRKQLAVMDNSTSDSSMFDFDLLQTDFEIDTLTDWGIDVEALGADVDTGEIVEDEIPEEVQTVCKRGDIWQLGNHRLMCGDSTSAEDVALLMDGNKADMVFTDPPYGMGLNTDYSSMISRLGFVKGGEKYEQGKIDDFNPEMIKNIFTCFDSVKEIFLWGGDYFAELLPDKNNGSWIVWDKRANENNDIKEDTSSDKMYGSCFELCWSKHKHKRDIARIKWAGLFGLEKDFDKKRHHPTQKPIALATWFLDRYSKCNHCIVDLFGGSGSTLIACEQTGRKCYTMELDEHYCDVIIARWEQLTGQKAVKL